MTPHANALSPGNKTLSAETSELSDDAFLGGAVNLYQPKSGYRAGTDAVLLAATVTGTQKSTNPKIHVLDVGAGVGTVGICLAHRNQDARITLVEKSPELTAIAHTNSKRNKLDDRLNIITTDISARPALIEATGLTPESYDYVLANPPFHSRGKGTSSSSKLKSNAHAMDDADLDHWLRFMVRMAKPGGVATLIHKAQVLGRLLTAMHGRFGAIRILPLHPRIGSPANRVIVTGIKGSKADLQICQGLVLHTNGHQFSDKLNSVLRNGAPLEF